MFIKQTIYFGVNNIDFRQSTMDLDEQNDEGGAPLRNKSLLIALGIIFLCAALQIAFRLV